MNKIIVTGNLTKDAELGYTPNEKAYSKFTIANNEGWGDNKKTNFFNCTLWGKSAESLKQYLVKGQKVLVTGKIEFNDYIDKEGNKRQATNLNVDMYGGVELLGNKEQSQENNIQNEYSVPGQIDDITPVSGEDLPF